jgi:hypothetical protein
LTAQGEEGILKTRAGYGFVCTFPRPEASVIPTQTPRRGASCQGAAAPSGPHRPRSCMLRRGRRCAVAHRRGGLGAAGSAAGAAGGAGVSGCKVLQSVTGAQEGAAGVAICFRMFQFVSILPPAPQRAATLGRVASKGRPAVAPAGAPRPTGARR